LADVAVETSEILAGIVIRVVEHRQFLAGELQTEPPALDPGEVPKQSVQTHPRRRDALLRQLLRPDSRALQLERLAVPIEVGGQDLAFIADQRKGDPAVHGPGLRIVLRRNVGHGASMPNRRLVLAVSVAGYLLPSKPM
jgi:hypothetical protein